MESWETILVSDAYYSTSTLIPAQAATSKFALVCGECFRHNGLVGGKHEWERMRRFILFDRANEQNGSALVSFAGVDCRPVVPLIPGCNHMNPAPLSRLNEATSDSPVTSTPRDITPTTPATPSQLSRPTPKPRRALGEKSTPRSSKLAQEVYSASAEEADDSAMDVDDK